MFHRHRFEALDRTLNEIMPNTILSDSMQLLFVGDLRTIYPVVLRGSKIQIVNAFENSSLPYHGFQTVRLTKNMGLQSPQHDSAASEQAV